MSGRKVYREEKKTSAFSVFEVFVIILLAIVIAFMAVLNLIFREEGEATSVLGYSFYKTKAVNMIPEIPQNTVIVAKQDEIANIKESSVILCNIGDFTALTRVVMLGDENGVPFYVVRFDAAPANETFRVEKSDVIAKAVWQLEAFGNFLDFATSLKGIIIAIVVPFLIIIVFQIVKITSIKKLEREASSLDDFDDIFVPKKEKLSPKAEPLQFGDKFERSNGKTATAPAKREQFKVEPKPQEVEKPRQTVPTSKMLVDERGRAEFKVSYEPEPKSEKVSPLFTYDMYDKKNADKNATTENIVEETDTPKKEEFTVTEQVAATKNVLSETISFRKQPEFSNELSPATSGAGAKHSSHISNVIPSNIANLQRTATVTDLSDDDADEKEYFKVERKPVRSFNEDSLNFTTIPKEAALPKETLAPAQKKKNSKTIDELMSIIDSEKTKLGK